MTQTIGNCYDILEALEEVPGRAISLIFSSPKELENFRVKLYQTKKRNEEHLIGIGFMTEEDRKSLVFKKSSAGCEALITLIPRKEEVKYLFCILDPEVKD